MTPPRAYLSRAPPGARQSGAAAWSAFWVLHAACLRHRRAPALSTPCLSSSAGCSAPHLSGGTLLDQPVEVLSNRVLHLHWPKRHRARWTGPAADVGRGTLHGITIGEQLHRRRQQRSPCGEWTAGRVYSLLEKPTQQVRPGSDRWRLMFWCPVRVRLVRVGLHF